MSGARRADSSDLMNKDFNLDRNLNDQFELRGKTVVARNVTTLLTVIASRLKQGTS